MIISVSTVKINYIWLTQNLLWFCHRIEKKTFFIFTFTFCFQRFHFNVGRLIIKFILMNLSSYLTSLLFLLLLSYPHFISYFSASFPWHFCLSFRLFSHRFMLKLLWLGLNFLLKFVYWFNFHYKYISFLWDAFRV